MAEGKFSTSEINLLKQEIEVLGDLLNDEKLDRKAEVDELRIEIDTLKKVMEALSPGFIKSYERLYKEHLRTLDPERGRDAQEAS